MENKTSPIGSGNITVLLRLPAVGIYFRLTTSERSPRPHFTSNREPFLLAIVLHAYLLCLPTMPCVVVRFLHLVHLNWTETHVFRQTRVRFFDLRQSLIVHSHFHK